MNGAFGVEYTKNWIASSTPYMIVAGTLDALKRTSTLVSFYVF